MSQTVTIRDIKSDVWILIAIIFLSWVSIYFPIHQSTSLVVVPRNTHNIPGILFACFFHADIEHFLNNMLVLTPMSLLIIFTNPGKFKSIILLIVISSGFLLWLLGKDGIHIGASGIAIGTCFYMILFGIFNFSRVNLSISLIALFYNLFLVLNFWRPEEGVSDDAHICGAFAGLLTSLYIVRPLKK